ncbi:MAG TPA: hypothetical protein VGG75_08500 [Trebonia sp.]|jgi:hypothetical protein
MPVFPGGRRVPVRPSFRDPRFVADAATYLVSVLVVFPLPVLPQPEESRDAGAGATGRSGAFAWGAGGTVFYTVAATTLQRLAPRGCWAGSRA